MLQTIKVTFLQIIPSIPQQQHIHPFDINLRDFLYAQHQPLTYSNAHPPTYPPQKIIPPSISYASHHNPPSTSPQTYIPPQPSPLTPLPSQNSTSNSPVSPREYSSSFEQLLNKIEPDL